MLLHDSLIYINPLIQQSKLSMKMSSLRWLFLILPVLGDDDGVRVYPVFQF